MLSILHAFILSQDQTHIICNLKYLYNIKLIKIKIYNKIIVVYKNKKVKKIKKYILVLIS